MKFTIADGEIVEFRDYFDLAPYAAMLEQN